MSSRFFYRSCVALGSSSLVASTLWMGITNIIRRVQWVGVPVSSPLAKIFNEVLPPLHIFYAAVSPLVTHSLSRASYGISSRVVPCASLLLNIQVSTLPSHLLSCSSKRDGAVHAVPCMTQKVVCAC